MAAYIKFFAALVGGAIIAAMTNVEFLLAVTYLIACMIFFKLEEDD